MNAQQVFEIFHDYWVGVAGAKGTKADWFATWKNWCRRENSNGANNGKQRTRSRIESRQDIVAEFAALAGYTGGHGQDQYPVSAFRSSMGSEMDGLSDDNGDSGGDCRVVTGPCWSD